MLYFTILQSNKCSESRCKKVKSKEHFFISPEFTKMFDSADSYEEKDVDGNIKSSLGIIKLSDLVKFFSPGAKKKEKNKKKQLNIKK